MDVSALRQTAPCFVTHNLALGGAQTAVLRWIAALPPWVRERTILYSQSTEMGLLEAAIEKGGFSVGSITNQPPNDPSSWILSYGNLMGLPPRPTSLLLHSWDAAGLRYINKAYGHLRDLSVAGVSRQVLDCFAPFIAKGGHRVLGVLPPPVTEWRLCTPPNQSRPRIVVWMGRPLESKGLLALPYLLKLDPHLVIRAWTGADTGGHESVQRTQQKSIDRLIKIATRLKVIDRLDLRPLDFDPMHYSHRLHGASALLGNSEREGFLLTAAEAMSCGVPVVMTRDCGVAEYVREGVNGALIDWHADPRRLARDAYRALQNVWALDPMHCLEGARQLSLAADYRSAHGATLSHLTHTALADPQPRVTVGVRIHHPMRVEHLDDAISSLAMQTYRQFKTVLLVDGPRAWGEMLARRYQLPLICTGLAADITHCSGLHRLAVEQCDTEFYKPLDYDDQLLPDYLSRAVHTLDERNADVYGCLLLTLEGKTLSPRAWPHRSLETMFTGNSDDNMLPHSSVLMRTALAKAAGNYQERAIGLGADDYHLWHRLHRKGARFVRDDAVRHVVYRIHERNSLVIRRRRYGGTSGPSRGGLIAGATAASIAVWAAPQRADASAPLPPDDMAMVQPANQGEKVPTHPVPVPGNRKAPLTHGNAPHSPGPMIPPHS